MYTIKEASARSGVGVSLLRAWERRYGVVRPTRTSSGYRLYDEDAIARLAAMRRLIDAGWAAQQAAERVRSATGDELEALAPDPAASVALDAAAPDVVPSERELLVDRIVAAAAQLDTAGLGAALDETLATLRFEAAWDGVLRPALGRIGDGWYRGEIDVAGEHATSQAIHRRLAMAFEAAGVASPDAPVLVGLPQGARHEFGALAFATAARRAGVPVLYLGADLPAESWTRAATNRAARAAVIGVPRRGDAERAEEAAAALVRARPDALVFLGGSHAERVEVPGARHLPDDSLAGAVTALRRALG